VSAWPHCVPRREDHGQERDAYERSSRPEIPAESLTGRTKQRHVALRAARPLVVIAHGLLQKFALRVKDLPPALLTKEGRREIRAAEFMRD
jgi:hypothetical protein